MNMNHLRHKTLTGARGLIILSALLIPLSYIINLVLGRISAETLGAYSAIQVLMQTIATFVLFGGGTVLSTFLPKTDKVAKKKGLIFLYFTLVIIIFIVVVLLYRYLPQQFVSRVKETLTIFDVRTVLIFSVTYTLALFLQYVLYGLMETSIAAFLNRLHLIFISVYLLLRAVLTDHIILDINYLIIIMIASNIIAIAIGLFFSVKNFSCKEKPEIFIPVGIWNFIMYAHLSTIFTYAYNNVDKMFILSLRDLGQLGVYQAILSMYTFSRFLPKLLIKVTVPLFSNLRMNGEVAILKKTIIKMEKYLVLMTIAVSLGIISYSEQLLALFGNSYVKYDNVVIIFMLSNAFTALSYIMTPLLIAYEKNKEKFFNSLLQICIQIILSFALFKNFGIMGIAIAKVVGVILAQAMPIYIVTHHLKLMERISNRYIWGVVITVVYTIVRLNLEFNIVTSSLLLMLMFSFFLYVGKYTKKDVKEFIFLITSKDK